MLELFNCILIINHPQQTQNQRQSFAVASWGLRDQQNHHSWQRALEGPTQ
jgi:hypothetical protein